MDGMFVYFNGKTYSKFFGDQKHGDSEQALSKAIRHRNCLEKELGKPRTDRKVVTYSPRNNTDVIGVMRTVKEGKEVYEVSWNPNPGVMQRTSISIERYGEEKAFLKACKLRKQKEKQMYGKAIGLKKETSLEQLSLQFSYKSISNLTV